MLCICLAYAVIACGAEPQAARSIPVKRARDSVSLVSFELTGRQLSVTHASSTPAYVRAALHSERLAYGCGATSAALAGPLNRRRSHEAGARLSEARSEPMRRGQRTITVTLEPDPPRAVRFCVLQAPMTGDLAVADFADGFSR